MTDVLRAEDDADLLAMVPRLAGYTARESLVCVAFAGKRSTQAFRLELPSRDRDADRRGLADAVIAVCRTLHRVDRVALVIYTDRSFEAEHGIPCDDLAQAVGRRVHRAGLHLAGCFCVAADGWGDYLAPRPRRARPLSDIATSPLADPSVPPIEALDALPAGDPALTEAVAAALGLVEAVPDPCTWMDEHLDREADERDLAELVVLAQWPAASSTVLVHAAFGIDHPHEADDAEAERLFDGRSRHRPDPDRIQAAAELVGRAAANVAPELRPPLLCMLAWLLWARGLLSLAARRLDEAAAIDPAFGPAARMREIVEVLPVWAVDPG